MTYKLLLPNEYHRLKGMIPEDAMPHPETSAVSVCEDGEEIVGCLVLQLQWHLEPLVLRSPAVNYMRLKEILDAQIRHFPNAHYYAFAENEHVVKMGERAGMQVLPFVTMYGKVS